MNTMTASGRRAMMAAAAACVLLVTAACNGLTPGMPQSGGSPYEVLLLTDNDTAGQTLTSALETYIAGLPQREKAFDVTPVHAATPDRTTRYARCMVIARLDGAEGRRTTIRYEKDAYASPQLIVYVCSPTAARLQRDIKSVAAPLTGLINRFETNTCIAALHRRNNAKGAKAVTGVTGWQMLIPEEMQAMKQGKDFVWLSDHATAGARNICVYTYPGTDDSATTLTAKRDSVMKANIPGGSNGTYMRTSHQAPVYHRKLRERGRDITEARGLWEMEGDAMGGPFVCRAQKDSRHNRTVVAEAFVYAPEQAKRNILRQLEAALATLRPSEHK